MTNTIEWTPQDIEAEREGAALLRLARRAGATYEALARFKASHYNSHRIGAPGIAGNAPGEIRRASYRAADARRAFDRLFAGEQPSPYLSPTRADAERCERNTALRAADVLAGSALRGLSRDEQRAALRGLRGVA